MTLLIAEAKRIIRARKRLVDLHPWANKSRDGKTLQSQFASRISIGGAIPQGLWFRCVIFPKYLDVATVQVEHEIPDRRQHLTLYRLEWHPLTSHGNGDIGPRCLRNQFFDVGESHEHCCMLHLCRETGRIRSGGVQTARRISPDFGSFQDVLGYVRAKLRIDNMDEMPHPDAQPEMF
jgi:hypothetical protein